MEICLQHRQPLPCPPLLIERRWTAASELQESQGEASSFSKVGCFLRLVQGGHICVSRVKIDGLIGLHKQS